MPRRWRYLRAARSLRTPEALGFHLPTRWGGRPWPKATAGSGLGARRRPFTSPLAGEVGPGRRPRPGGGWEHAEGLSPPHSVGRSALAEGHGRVGAGSTQKRYLARLGNFADAIDGVQPRRGLSLQAQ